MKARLAVWLLLGALAASSLTFGTPRPQSRPRPKPQARPRYHCFCDDICRKVPPADRCHVRRCNGNPGS